MYWQLWDILAKSGTIYVGENKNLTNTKARGSVTTINEKKIQNILILTKPFQRREKKEQKYIV